eukprot:g4239.t1
MMARSNNNTGFEGDVSDDATEQQSWVEAYLSRKESIFYCKIDDSYIKDPFNLYDLREKMNVDSSRFRRLIKIITTSSRVEDIVSDYALRNNNSSEDNFNLDRIRQRFIKEARKLYGLIHARFICTSRGLSYMRMKYENGDFGRCRAANCNNFKLVPIGTSDDYNQGKVKVYCDCCGKIYRPKSQSQKEDGAFWGRTFP